MNSELPSRLSTLLEEKEDSLFFAWERGFGSSELWQSLWLNGETHPARKLIHDLARVLEGKTPVNRPGPAADELKEIEHPAVWKYGLCHGAEMFLKGEGIVRDWALQHLILNDREKLEVFEAINRAFQQLFQFHASRYCETCRAVLTAR